MDTGPELTAEHFVAWCASQGMAIHDIPPGKPDQNASIERFNRSDRTDVFDAYLFESMAEACQLTKEWLRTYNDERPHDSLGQVPLLTLARGPTPPGSLPSDCLLDAGAYALTGHKTRSIFDRYDIVSPGDLKDAASKLNDRADGQRMLIDPAKPDPTQANTSQAGIGDNTTRRAG